MNRRAFFRDERVAALTHIDRALAEVRSCIEAAPDVGPLLVECYRCLSALGQARVIIAGLPEIKKDAG